MTWLMGIIGFLIGLSAGYVFGFTSGLTIAGRIVLFVACDKCKAELERIYSQTE